MRSAVLDSSTALHPDRMPVAGADSCGFTAVPRRADAYNTQQITFRYRPLIITGPACSHTRDIVHALCDTFPHFFHVVTSHTSRKQRKNELHATHRHYHFCNRAQMQLAIHQEQFFEHMQMHGDLYGITHEEIQLGAESGKICIFQVDMQGVVKLKAMELQPHCIFVGPTSLYLLSGLHLHLR